MVTTPPFILVFDISALSVSSPSEWREFSRVGSCYLPQVVYEEMRLLFDRSPDPDLERIAKAFTRFYGSSGWKITDINAHHPLLKVASGQALTRRARVSLAVGKCAYGLAQAFPNSMVVLISKDRTLLQRLYEIPCVNLCGITGDSLLQWSRTGQRPVAISQKLQQFRASHGILPNTTGLSHAPQRTSPTRLTPAPSKPSLLRQATSIPGWVPDLVSLLLAVGGMAIAAYLIWLLVQNNGDLRKLFPKTSLASPSLSQGNVLVLP